MGEIENFSQNDYDKTPAEEAIGDDVIDRLFDNGEFVEGCDDAAVSINLEKSEAVIYLNYRPAD